MLRRLAIVCLTLLAALALAAYLLFLYPLRNPHPAVLLSEDTLAIREATVYPSPDDPPVPHVTILIQNGRIAAIGPAIALPANTHILSCNGCVVTAGFWNTHVHFTEPKWDLAAFKSPVTLNAQLSDMLTSRGFTTVVDTGSDLRVTISLRRRIETGELLGPGIYTAGSGQYPPNGIPFYLRDTLPPFLLRFLPQPKSPAEAAHIEQTNIARGADILKLFTGSLVTRSQVLPMPLDNATAAVRVAHDHHQLAFAHPSSLAGMLIARDSGVDVLAHAPSEPEGVTPAILKSIVDRHMSMIPTLKMFGTTVTTKPSFLDPIIAEVRQFHALHGDLLFGTDVGYMTDYTTADEFTYLQRAGLSQMDILRMLTTAPAARLKVQREKGRVAVGALADLVILASDPASDPAAFSNVQATIRSGQVIYTRP